MFRIGEDIRGKRKTSLEPLHGYAGGGEVDRFGYIFGSRGVKTCCGLALEHFYYFFIRDGSNAHPDPDLWTSH